MSAAPKGMTAIDGGVEDGIAWAIVRAPMWGAVNGYAQVPEDHPWHGLGYDDIDVEAHGGLTYAQDGWIGFDTLHAGDHWPGADHHFHDDYCHHWTEAEVAEKARALAGQVAAVERVTW